VNIIAPHYGHEIVVTRYTAPNGNVDAYGVVCLDCEVSLFDENA